MTIRLKVRILLLVSISLTVFYIVSHVYRIDSWFGENTIVVVKDDATAAKYETAVHSTSDHLQLNATKNAVPPSTVDTKIKALKSPNNDLLTQHQPNNRGRYLKNPPERHTGLQAKNRGDAEHVKDTTKGVPDDAKAPIIERETASKPSASEANVFRTITKPAENNSDSKTGIEKDVSVFSTDDNSADDGESGENEAGKLSSDNEAGKSSDDRNFDSGSNDEDETSKEEEAPHRILKYGSEVPPTAMTPLSSSSSSKIYFKSIEIPSNKTDDVALHKSILSMAVTLPPTLPTTPATLCEENDGIGEEKPTTKSNCDLYSNHLNTCAESARYYNEDNLGSGMNCSDAKNPPICFFVNSTRTDDISKLNLRCNYSMCTKNAINVGILNATSGKVSYMFLNDIGTIVKTLQQETGYDLKEHGADFIFLSCMSATNKNKRIHQILAFPPLIMKRKVRKRVLAATEKAADADRLNINIVVLDSLSRKHFYRTLRKTADAMRSINMDKSNPNMVLDFKGFQSLAPFTYVNLQALLTGSVEFDSISTRRYNFEDLFTLFLNSGYQTLLQEDTCWHDEWGSILTGNRKLDKNDPNHHRKTWKEIKNLTMHHGIDSFGMTHMSCDVLLKFGVTNLYNSNYMYCLNGDPLSSYFLDHILDHIITRNLTTNAMPLLSYTHINIAHESSATRIVGLDEYLEKFISVLGMTSNTLTLFLSDHGGKTNAYFMDTLAGRFEVYDPFLFMMIPKRLKGIVGKKNIQSLIDNQNSLLDVIDLRSMLLTLNKILTNKGKKMKMEDMPNLLTESIKRRADCQHISIRNYALCKCFSNVTFPNKEDDKYKEFIVWLGEFAVGYLNNKLASQQLPSSLGHRCTRIIGNNKENSIRNIMERQSTRGVIYVFDVLTKYGDQDEVFNFQVLFNDKRNEKYELLQVEHWLRVSIYSRFASCKDKNVSHELCMCTDGQREIIDSKYLSGYKQFDTPTESVAIANSTSCAFLLKRTNLYVVTYELVNKCEKKIKVELSTAVKYSWVASQRLPVEASVKAHSIQFLVTFIKVVDLKEDIQPRIIIRK